MMKYEVSRTCFSAPGSAMKFSVPYLILAAIPLRTEGIVALPYF